MVEPTPKQQQQLTLLANYLFARREAILTDYWTICRSDPSLPVSNSLMREEFNDNIPLALTVLEQRLSNQPPSADLPTIAREHGLHRWHKGYSLRELLQEVNLLQLRLADELYTFSTLEADLELYSMTLAYRELSRFFHIMIIASTAEYHELQQLEANERAETLQHALQQVSGLVRERGEFLRMTSHDLRGSFSVLHGAASLLSRPGTNEEERNQMMKFMNRNLTNIRDILIQLTDLARLEAGQEKLELKTFDAADLLRTIAESVRQLAEDRQLHLMTNGPESLRVYSDPVKVQRIVQNLLHNALKYTKSGFISVSWALEDDSRWIISIQDSGPGLPAGPKALMADKLKPVDEHGGIYQRHSSPYASEEASPPEDALRLPESEGVGLHVVKRLCELLGGTMNVETLAGRGTVFRIRLLLNQEQQHQPAA